MHDNQSQLSLGRSGRLSSFLKNPKINLYSYFAKKENKTKTYLLEIELENQNNNSSSKKGKKSKRVYIEHYGNNELSSGDTQKLPNNQQQNYAIEFDKSFSSQQDYEQESERSSSPQQNYQMDFDRIPSQQQNPLFPGAKLPIFCNFKLEDIGYESKGNGTGRILTRGGGNFHQPLQPNQPFEHHAFNPFKGPTSAHNPSQSKKEFRSPPYPATLPPPPSPSPSGSGSSKDKILQSISNQFNSIKTNQNNKGVILIGIAAFTTIIIILVSKLLKKSDEMERDTTWLDSGQNNNNNKVSENSKLNKNNNKRKKPQKNNDKKSAETKKSADPEKPIETERPTEREKLKEKKSPEPSDGSSSELSHRNSHAGADSPRAKSACCPRACCGQGGRMKGETNDYSNGTFTLPYFRNFDWEDLECKPPQKPPKSYPPPTCPACPTIEKGCVCYGEDNKKQNLKEKGSIKSQKSETKSNEKRLSGSSNNNGNNFKVFNGNKKINNNDSPMVKNNNTLKKTIATSNRISHNKNINNNFHKYLQPFPLNNDKSHLYPAFRNFDPQELDFMPPPQQPYSPPQPPPPSALAEHPQTLLPTQPTHHPHPSKPLHTSPLSQQSHLSQPSYLSEPSHHSHNSLHSHSSHQSHASYHSSPPRHSPHSRHLLRSRNSPRSHLYPLNQNLYPPDPPLSPYSYERPLSRHHLEPPRMHQTLPLDLLPPPSGLHPYDYLSSLHPYEYSYPPPHPHLYSKSSERLPHGGEYPGPLYYQHSAHQPLTPSYLNMSVDFQRASPYSQYSMNIAGDVPMWNPKLEEKERRKKELLKRERFERDMEEWRTVKRERLHQMETILRNRNNSNAIESNIQLMNDKNTNNNNKYIHAPFTPTLYHAPMTQEKGINDSLKQFYPSFRNFDPQKLDYVPPRSQNSPLRPNSLSYPAPYLPRYRNLPLPRHSPLLEYSPSHASHYSDLPSSAHSLPHSSHSLERLRHHNSLYRKPCTDQRKSILGRNPSYPRVPMDIPRHSSYSFSDRGKYKSYANHNNYLSSKRLWKERQELKRELFERERQEKEMQGWEEKERKMKEKLKRMEEEEREQKEREEREMNERARKMEDNVRREYQVKEKISNSKNETYSNAKNNSKSKKVDYSLDLRPNQWNCVRTIPENRSSLLEKRIQARSNGVKCTIILPSYKTGAKKLMICQEDTNPCCYDVECDDDMFILDLCPKCRTRCAEGCCCKKPGNPACRLDCCPPHCKCHRCPYTCCRLDDGDADNLFGCQRRSRRAEQSSTLDEPWDGSRSRKSGKSGFPQFSSLSEDDFSDSRQTRNNYRGTRDSSRQSRNFSRQASERSSRRSGRSTREEDLTTDINGMPFFPRNSQESADSLNKTVRFNHQQSGENYTQHANPGNTSSEQYLLDQLKIERVFPGKKPCGEGEGNEKLFKLPGFTSRCRRLCPGCLDPVVERTRRFVHIECPKSKKVSIVRESSLFECPSKECCDPGEECECWDMDDDMKDMVTVKNHKNGESYMLNLKTMKVEAIMQHS